MKGPLYLLREESRDNRLEDCLSLPLQFEAYHLISPHFLDSLFRNDRKEYNILEKHVIPVPTNRDTLQRESSLVTILSSIVQLVLFELPDFNL